MFDNVLIGIDGRQGGRDALALGRRLAAPQANLILAHTYDADWMLEPMPYDKELAEQLLVDERAAAGIEAELVTWAGAPPGRGLHEIAEHRGADLLVVGSTRHAVLGRALMGDDTRSAFNGAPCAIAVAPRGYAIANHEMRTLGVGYDDSVQSQQALAVARELAPRLNAAIRALWVVSLENVNEARPIPADWPKAAGELVDRCSRQLAQIEGVEGESVYGGPREELSRLSHEVDLLILGSRGYGPLHRMLHGSVSGYLVRHVACPLLVLKRHAFADGGDGEHATATRARVAAST